MERRLHTIELPRFVGVWRCVRLGLLQAVAETQRKDCAVCVRLQVDNGSLAEDPLGRGGKAGRAK